VFLPKLIEMDIQSLSLANTGLTFLPKDFSRLRALTKLNIRGNLFNSITYIMDSLKDLPNLKELGINLKTREEAQLILNSLPDLEVLNDQRIEDSSQDVTEKESSELEEKLPTLDDLGEVAKVYDKIKVIRRQKKPEEDKMLSKYFETQMTVVIKELHNKLSETLPENIKCAMILKAKYVLVNIAFTKMIETCSTSKSISKTWNKIQKIHNKVFNHLTEMLVYILSDNVNSYSMFAANKDLSSKLQDEIERLKTVVQSLEKKLTAVQAENENLNKQKEDLTEQLVSLEEENKKYFTVIVNRSKDVNKDSTFQDTTIDPVKCYSNMKDSIKYNSVPSLNKVETVKVPSLKTIKDLINDIYTQKRKHDEKCTRTKAPKETMEEYMYTYLYQKYGLKTLMIEWATIIIHSIREYSKKDSDIRLFGKILQNRCDEEYRLVHLEVKLTIAKLLTEELKVSIQENSGLRTLSGILGKQIEEVVYKSIIEKMYNKEDADKLLNILKSTKLILCDDFINVRIRV